jgi:hypothetical protein
MSFDLELFLETRTRGYKNQITAQQRPVVTFHENFRLLFWEPQVLWSFVEKNRNWMLFWSWKFLNYWSHRLFDFLKIKNLNNLK